MKQNRVQLHEGAAGNVADNQQTEPMAVDTASVGLTGGVRGCLFDLDGVITKTAAVHAAAWKEMFDAYLRGAAAHSGGRFVPFDAVADYDAYVDGKSRADGTRSVLASRGMSLLRSVSGSTRRTQRLP